MLVLPHPMFDAQKEHENRDLRDIAPRGSQVAINGSFASRRQTVNNVPQRIEKVVPSDKFKKYVIFF